MCEVGSVALIRSVVMLILLLLLLLLLLAGMLVAEGKGSGGKRWLCGGVALS